MARIPQQFPRQFPGLEKTFFSLDFPWRVATLLFHNYSQLLGVKKSLTKGRLADKRALYNFGINTYIIIFRKNNIYLIISMKNITSRPA